MFPDRLYALLFKELDVNTAHPNMLEISVLLVIAVMVYRLSSLGTVSG